MTLRPGATRNAIMVAIAVAAVVSLAVVLNAWIGALVVPIMHHAPSASDLLVKVSVINTKPLVLSAKLTWNSTDDNIWISEARVTDYNQTVVATFRGEWVDGEDGYGKPICMLQNFGEEKMLTMDFKTSLAPGDYSLWFCTNSYAGFTHADVTVP
jgi:hypothetical protein